MALRTRRHACGFIVDKHTCMNTIHLLLTLYFYLFVSNVSGMYICIIKRFKGNKMFVKFWSTCHEGDERNDNKLRGKVSCCTSVSCSRAGVNDFEPGTWSACFCGCVC